MVARGASGILALLAIAVTAAAAPREQADPTIEYRVETLTNANRDLTSRFSGPEIELLEKLNRADASHMRRLKQIVVPVTWKTELEHSPFPPTYQAAVETPKLIVVDQASQAFAAYEYGQQVRWGPVSSGRRARPTPSGTFHLNWRARTHISTVDAGWKMNWYFNFHNTDGLALHEYALPGVPASHACVRLLARDAEWIYNWGDGWSLDDKGQLVTSGTPVLIIGTYAFGSPPPWLSGNRITITLP